MSYVKCRILKIALATTDIKAAMEFSDIFMMVCPSFAQEIMFNSMIPYLRDGMKIFIVPGNYGGLILNKCLQKSESGYGHHIFRYH